MKKRSITQRLSAAVFGVATIWISSKSQLFAGAAVNTAGPVQQGQSDGGTGDPALNNPAVVISFSGQTALRTFDTSSAITELQPGTSIVLHDGTDGAPIEYIAPNDSDTNVQLANPNFNNADYTIDSNGFLQPVGTPADPSDNDIQLNSAIETQWHEQGSVDGFYDLINDEVGYAQNSTQALADSSTVGPISNESLRTPSSSNPTWINTNKFTGAGTTGGFTLNNSGADDLALTYSTNVYTQATGVNILGGQNRIQFSVGEYPTEAFSVGGGTASPFATAGSAGYGLGNPALASSSVALTSLGTGGFRQTYQSTNIANESTAIDDPQTDTNYSSGPWNTAGANNITSTPIAATAVTYSANPGTGLLRIDLGDAQWLQTTGRLQNGALFNVVARTVDTGQRVVFALNTGIDPSWAVGSNDDGNSTSTASANAQHSIGASLRFDGKTSGTEAEKTIAQSRMSLGALSVPEARAAASNAPVRALDVDFNDQTDVNPGDDSTNFVRADFSTIVSSDNATRYQAVLISHYNTVKTPNATALYNELVTLGLVNANDSSINPGDVTNTSLVSEANQQTAWADVQSFNPSNLSDPTTSGIKGDPTGDVAAFIANISNSVATAANGVNSPNSANDPADGLLSIGFLLPDLLDWTRTTDGGPITPVTLSPTAQAEQSQAESNYGALFSTDQSAAANGNTIGSGATYADGNSGGPAVYGSIPITAKDVTWTGGTVTSVNTAANGDLTAAGGNYLFGNFNQNGVRDYSDVQQAVNAALSLYAVDGAAGGDNNIFVNGGSGSVTLGVANSTTIPSLAGNPGWQQTGTNTKGDLITLGDFNGDGSFNGEDIYLLAIGASLADSTSSTTLTATATNFSDVVRNPNDVLLKNTALNYVNNYLNTTSDTTGAAFLRQTARALLSGSTVPAGATDLHSTDPITGLEQYTYDPSGANAFNSRDVDRDGVVDFNDAVLVDEYNGQSYQNLTQSLAAVEPTPYTGVAEPLSLVAVQQVDGESAIGSADLAVINSGLTGAGNANWYPYNLEKEGPGTITWARTAGTITVYSGATFGITSGAVQVGGTLDPFSDDNASGPTVGNHVGVTVGAGALLQFTQTQKTSTVSGLTINPNGVVDIGSNALVIDFGSNPDPIGNIVGYLNSGYASGAWTGTGINSSTAAAAHGSSPTVSVGYADGNTDTATAASANQIVIKYTLAGDANLDGRVNFTDFSVLIANYGKTGTDWAHGNFVYGPGTNFTDFSKVIANYGQSLPPVGGGSAESVGNQSIALAASVHTVPSAVPEPASMTMIAAGAAGLLARRRRKQIRIP